MQQWADHLILYHGHFVVDLNGTEDREFRSWCHQRWGHNRPKNPVRRGAYVQRLYKNRTIQQSLQTLARYPLKTPFYYHVPKNNRGQLVNQQRRYELTILSAMCRYDPSGIGGVRTQRGI